LRKFEIDAYGAIEKNISTLVLNFSKIDSIDSTGISHLLKLSRKAILSDVELILCELGDSLKRLFETAQMDKFFNILTLDALKEKYF
jgi:anti-anti-sigma factor